MNWGYKILFVYIAFVLGILFLVFKSSSQKMDLVTTDYYAKELKYQEKIDENKRVEKLSAPVKCTLQEHSILVDFPNDFSGKQLEGEAVMYCPSDEDKDNAHSFREKSTHISIPLAHELKGAYELHLSWKVDGISYYYEQKLIN
jgi:hypothetical protein